MERKEFTILVVDDEELLRNMLQKWLEASGYKGEKIIFYFEIKGTKYF